VCSRHGFTLVNEDSELYALSRFASTEWESPPPDLLKNTLIFQVPEGILIYCEGGGLTKTSALVSICQKLLIEFP
jgi:hypothetical protein